MSSTANETKSTDPTFASVRTKYATLRHLPDTSPGGSSVHLPPMTDNLTLTGINWLSEFSASGTIFSNPTQPSKRSTGSHEPNMGRRVGSLTKSLKTSRQSSPAVMHILWARCCRGQLVIHCCWKRKTNYRRRKVAWTIKRTSRPWTL